MRFFCTELMIWVNLRALLLSLIPSPLPITKLVLGKPLTLELVQELDSELYRK